LSVALAFYLIYWVSPCFTTILTAIVMGKLMMRRKVLRMWRLESKTPPAWISGEIQYVQAHGAIQSEISFLTI
jgi:hypothetical protein